MSRVAKRSRLWIVIGLGCVAVAIWWYYPRPPAEISPAPPNPFVDNLVVSNLTTGADVTAPVEIQVNSGFTALISCVPKADRPVALESRDVQSPNLWPMTLVIYPRGDNPDSHDTIQAACRMLEEPGRRVTAGRLSSEPPLFAPPLGSMAHFKDSGFRKLPAPVMRLSHDAMQYWTYFAVKADRPGDYVYEISLYPASAWVSDVRFEAGPRVILQRGVLRVLPESGAS